MVETRIKPGFGSPEDISRETFIRAESFARKMPGGWVKKIVFDADGGYPEHSHGFIQYSPRPYRQGCDGTTDNNIHLIASVLCERLGIDYSKSYLSSAS